MKKDKLGLKEFALIGGFVLWSVIMYYYGTLHADGKLTADNKELRKDNDSLHSYIKRNQPVYKVGLNQLMKGK